MKTVIINATIVNEGERFIGSVFITNHSISKVVRGTECRICKTDNVIDATGMFLIPGVIDDHVHFREPGLTEKACVATESRAAAAGGVTSFMDMPNTIPQTTTLMALSDKNSIAKKESVINYSFYFGATNSNVNLIKRLNPRTVCGIKLFMGSSTGNMLVDEREKLEEIFASTSMPIAVHCEDSNIIAQNAERIQAYAGKDPDIKFHPKIRSNEACYKSSQLAVELAKKYGTRLNLLHVSTADEIELLTAGKPEDKLITAEVTPAHLTFCEQDYTTLGARIKCNPAIKSKKDRDALRRALIEGKIDIIGTDHAPHLIEQKLGGALGAASGIPTIQFSLLNMLRLCDEGILEINDVVEKMCHAPATIYKIKKRGYIREGYYADIVLLNPDKKTVVNKDIIHSRCKWSPFEGETFEWSVEQTWVNGKLLYDKGYFNENVRGKALSFQR